MTEKEALLYAQMYEHKNLVRKTQGFIRWALEKVSNPYVACSFGKDSSVMLHLILEQRPDIPIRFVRWKNETEYLANFDEVISAWGDINLTQVELLRESVDDKVKDRFSTAEYDSFFIGFRIDESKERRITLKHHGLFFKMKDGKTRISPMADWTTKHIAAYNCEHNLPTLDTYTEFGFDERTSSRVPRSDRGIRSHSMRTLKEKDVTKFNQLLKLHPEISNYV